jgi:hypothetical protein
LTEKRIVERLKRVGRRERTGEIIERRVHVSG